MFFKLFLAAIFIGYLSLVAAIVANLFGLRLRAAHDVRERVPSPESEEEILLQLIDVQKAFDHPVLRGINLKIRRGETLGVLGKSGTGKSVLLKLTVGFLRPDSGRILFKSQDLNKMNETELLAVRERVSYVFQGGAVFDFVNVRENIAYPLREQGIVDDQLIDKRVDYLLDAVELEGMGELRSHELSMGAKKQVAIARAIATDPEAILYDEPTTGVDPLIGKSLSRLIRKLNKQENLTSIVVTHDLKCIDIVADRVILLKNGLIHFEGSKEDFHASKDAFVQAFIAGRHYEEEDEVLAS